MSAPTSSHSSIGRRASFASLVSVLVVCGAACDAGDDLPFPRTVRATDPIAAPGASGANAAQRDGGSLAGDGSSAPGEPPPLDAAVSNVGDHCLSSSSLDLWDAQGALDPARYRALAAAFHTKEAVGFRFGPDASRFHTTPETFATAYSPSDKAFSHGTNQPMSTWQIGGPFETDPGGYNSSSGQVLYIPDDTNAPGIDAIQFLEVSSNVVSQKPQLSWTAYGGGAPDQSTKEPAMLAAHGGAFRHPVAIARAVTTDQWTQDAIVAFQDGTLLSTGTHASGGSSNVLAKLPAGLVPTAIALTTNNELALVTVWDTANVRGGVAVVALGGPMTPGFWGDWQKVYPALHSYGLFSFMKVLGVVWIPGMVAPTAIAASADIRWPMIGAPEPSTLDLSVPSTRARFATGGDLASRVAMAGFAMVMSRAEKKVAFLDLQPFFEHVRKSYFGTSADFEHTKNVGPGANQWPDTFDVTPSATPVVVQTIALDSCPTAVATSINVFRPHNFVDANDDRHAYVASTFLAHAIVGTEEGALRVYDVAGLKDDGPASAAAIHEVTRVAVGRNPTSIVPLNRSGAQFDHPVDYAVVSRGDRRVELFHGDPKASTLTRFLTITDSRLVDPVSVEDVTWFGNFVPLVEVADFAGRQLVAYRYGQARLDFYGGATIGVGPTGSDPFECGGVYPVPGGALFASATNVP